MIQQEVVVVVVVVGCQWTSKKISVESFLASEFFKKIYFLQKVVLLDI